MIESIRANIRSEQFVMAQIVGYVKGRRVWIINPLQAAADPQSTGELSTQVTENVNTSQS